MSDSNRTVTVSTKVDQGMVDFVDGQTETENVTRDELLRKLLVHFRTAREDGLRCPHCKNELQVEL